MANDVIIHEICGNCPVQAEGTIMGVPFYFRSRGNTAAIGIGEDPVGVTLGSDGFYRSEQIGDSAFAAGWISEGQACAMIHKWAEEYKKEVSNGSE